MKKLVLIALTLFVAFSAQAQKATAEQADEIAILQSIYGMGKRDMVAQFLKLTEAEATKFWPIYDEYEIARKEIGTKRANNVIDFANNYSKLTDVKADELTKTSFAVNGGFVKLSQKTYSKIAKAISPIRAAQFTQFELYLENVIRMELMQEVPLIGEFETVKK